MDPLDQLLELSYFDDDDPLAVQTRIVRAESGKKRSILGDIDIDTFVKNVEADRLLLAEIRKQVPNKRGEAEVYLARLKILASRSDPIRLVPLVNRVLAQANIYFDWLDYEFESAEERVSEYYIGGARGVHFALEAFKSAVLLTAINRLEMAAKIIREIPREIPRETPRETPPESPIETVQ